MKNTFKALFILLMSLFTMTVSADTQNEEFQKARKKMVSSQIKNRGIEDPLVLEAMRTVPRHRFVPQALRDRAYGDSPLPIGEGQTISQPYIVALMTETLKLQGHERVLEIGTGSGYQAAILSRMAKEVYTMEIKKKLQEKASKLLEEMYPGQIKTRLEDGYFGWKKEAPFDCIMITAAVDHIPPPLLMQLKDGGKLVLPLGNPFSYQNLVLVTKKGEDYKVKQITGVLFVPMTGQALEP